jgi:hypothetical protein
VQHGLGDAVGEGRPGARSRASAWASASSASGAHQAVEEAPAFTLLAAHGAAGVQQLAGAALADDARQHGAGAHVAAGQADAVEQEGGLRAPCPGAGRSHRQDGAGTGAHAVDGGDDGLRAGAHGLDQVAGHAREHQQLGRLQLDQRADDLVHVAAEQKLPPAPDDHHGIDVASA